MSYSPEVVARFMRHVDVKGPDECWNWQAARCPKGYGFFKLSPKMLRSHRVSHEIHIGPIPEGLSVLHSCDNPSCVNPAHLRAGTQKENIYDRESRGRGVSHNKPHRWPAPPPPGKARGERAGSAKLTDELVREVRRRWPAETQWQIARSLGMGQSAVSSIITRKTWTHI